MKVFQRLVAAGAPGVPPLLEALRSDDVGLQIFAAQTLGYLPDVPAQPLVDIIRDENSSDSVKLYAIDALGMQGYDNVDQMLGDWQPADADVRKHLSYVRVRQGKPIAPEIIESIRQLDSDTLDSARLNEPAPDFQLDTIAGETVRLSEFQGDKNVVLVFIYGDT